MKRIELYAGEGRRYTPICLADHFFERLRGLMYKKNMGGMEGLLIMPCKQVHTYGMRFPIHAVFLDCEMRVVHVEREMPAGRVSPYVKSAQSVLELAADTPLPDVGVQMRCVYMGRENHGA